MRSALGWKYLFSILSLLDTKHPNLNVASFLSLVAHVALFWNIECSQISNHPYLSNHYFIRQNFSASRAEHALISRLPRVTDWSSHGNEITQSVEQVTVVAELMGHPLDAARLQSNIHHFTQWPTGLWVTVCSFVSHVLAFLRHIRLK